jgi:hypothetical protein
LSPLVIHSKGDGKWIAAPPTGLPSGSAAVWVSAPGEVYVIDGVSVVHMKPGGSWVKEDTGPRGALEALSAIWGSSPTNILMATDGGHLLHSKGDGRWFSELIDPATPDLFVMGIWGTSESNVYLLYRGGVLHGQAQ